MSSSRHHLGDRPNHNSPTCAFKDPMLRLPPSCGKLKEMAILDVEELTKEQDKLQELDELQEQYKLQWPNKTQVDVFDVQRVDTLFGFIKRSVLAEEGGTNMFFDN